MTSERPKDPDLHPVSAVVKPHPGAELPIEPWQFEDLQKKPADTKSGKVETDPAPGVHTEHGGQAGPEPTRYGDWEKNGRCTDF